MNLIYISYKLDSRVSKGARRLLDCLLTFGGQNSEAAINIYPSNPTLATRLNAHVRTVIRWKNELETLGIMVRYYDPIQKRELIKIPFAALDDYSAAKPVSPSVTFCHPPKQESVSPSVTFCHTTLLTLSYSKSNNNKGEQVMPITLKNKGPEFVDLDERREWLTTKLAEMKEAGEIQGEARLMPVADLVTEISFHIDNRKDGISSKHAANAALKWLREGRWATPLKLQVQRREEAEIKEAVYLREKDILRAQEVKAYNNYYNAIIPIAEPLDDKTERLIKYVEARNQRGEIPALWPKYKYAEPILRLKMLSFEFYEESIDIGQQGSYSG